MCKPYVLVRRITKNGLRLSDGRSGNLHVCPCLLELVQRRFAYSRVKNESRCKRGDCLEWGFASGGSAVVQCTPTFVLFTFLTLF